MCDLNKNPNLNKINRKNKSFNSFITNKFSLLYLNMFPQEPTPYSLNKKENY